MNSIHWIRSKWLKFSHKWECDWQIKFTTSARKHDVGTSFLNYHCFDHLRLGDQLSWKLIGRCYRIGSTDSVANRPEANQVNQVNNLRRIRKNWQKIQVETLLEGTALEVRNQFLDTQSWDCFPKVMLRYRESVLQSLYRLPWDSSLLHGQSIALGESCVIRGCQVNRQNVTCDAHRLWLTQAVMKASSARKIRKIPHQKQQNIKTNFT